jgi:hypothetical protein
MRVGAPSGLAAASMIPVGPVGGESVVRQHVVAGVVGVLRVRLPGSV